MDLYDWTMPRLRKLVPLDDDELERIVSYTCKLPLQGAAQYLESMVGDSPEALEFITSFIGRLPALEMEELVHNSGKINDKVAKRKIQNMEQYNARAVAPPPSYTPSSKTPPSSSATWLSFGSNHTNVVIEAGRERARDEQDMQQMLQKAQYDLGIFNSEIEPEHDADFPCYCSVHEYMRRKSERLGVQERWAKAVMYPGEKHYTDAIFPALRNPYMRSSIPSPFPNQQTYTHRQMAPRPVPDLHARWIRNVIHTNNRLNKEAQAKVDAQEPKESIWADETQSLRSGNPALTSTKDSKSDLDKVTSEQILEEVPVKDRQSSGISLSSNKDKSTSRFTSFKKAIGLKSSEQKESEKAHELCRAILAEEKGRWPDEHSRQIVAAYQDKVGITGKIANLRTRCPIQYLHLLRAGYFEPIPVAWADQPSNPLKFAIEPLVGWRGITPAWRGYEDLAEERLYWVLNQRINTQTIQMKPDFISSIDMAAARMARAVEPPPLYFSADDTCHAQHTSEGYSKQVMPPLFHLNDLPETLTDETMILLDVSSSMVFDPSSPIYDRYLVTGWESTTQPKTKDVAKSIVRRFTDALSNYTHRTAGYDLVTFSSRATHIGPITHATFDAVWSTVRFGGGTRVMTGWQAVKELHFSRHAETATRHPVFGWQAGPATPILRLLLVLDGEATDMDEFEMDLLMAEWAHVTVFLVGAEGCLHHHRHANKLERIGSVNRHVAFVDAQGNCPERFVTHELLKRHLGWDVSIEEFERWEALPAYSEV